MGRGRTGNGVEVRPGNIRISFTWQETRCRETIHREPSPANLKYAERLVVEIRRRIELGNFRYGEFFPDSPHAAREVRPRGTLRELGELWLRTKGQKAANTRSQYRVALEFWYFHLDEAGGGARPIAEFTHGELSAFIGSYPWRGTEEKPKVGWQHCNNYLVVLRGVFALAKKDRHITDNPMDDIQNMDKVKKRPDPLSADEAELIIEDIRTHYAEPVFNYFDFALQTGMRPEELIALRWSDIDWNARTIRVQRARTFRGQTKVTKTGEERDVDLSPRALAALTRQKKFTFLGSAAKEADDIFQNPVTRRPWHDERSQRDHYWNPALQRSGIRRRRAYATRHTYATRLIMGGANPAYIAAQMGHTQAVLWSTYTTWLQAADKGNQAAKMGAILGHGFGEIVPNSSPAATSKT